MLQSKYTITVNNLIWDDWNRDHITKHGITVDEVEKVCQHKNKIYETYRNRIEVEGKTKTGRLIKIVLSSQDRNLKPYETGSFYPITAFEQKI